MKALNLLSVISAAALVLAGCASAPVSNEFRLPIKDELSTTERSSAQSMQPRDVIDVMFKFDTLNKSVYRLAAHDKLKIRFLSASEYDDSYQIRPDGYLSMPFIGDIKAAGMTVEEFRSRLEKLYEPVLKKPEFHVNLLEYQVHLKELQSALFHPTLGSSRLVTVRDDYKVTLPLIGEIVTKDKTLDEVKALANQKYSSINPGLQVDLLLQSSEPSRIFVFGEVKSPGAHPIVSPVSLMQAVAMSGGANSTAELGSVVAMRREGNEVVAKVFDLNDALRGQSSAFTTEIRPNDVVYVPATRLSNSGQIMRQLADTLLFNGVGFGFSYRVDNKNEE